MIKKLFPETEGFIMTIQDQIITTKNYYEHILKDAIIQNDRYRKCKQQRETIDYITGGCKILAGAEYINRHNIAAKIIHQEIARKYNLTIRRKANHTRRWEVQIILRLHHLHRQNNREQPTWHHTPRLDKTNSPLNRHSCIKWYKYTEQKSRKSIKIYTTGNRNRKHMEPKKVYIVPLIMSSIEIIPHTFVKNV